MTDRRRVTIWVAAALTATTFASTGHAAVPITAEEAMTNYQKSVETRSLVECRRTAQGDEIVVCGRSGRPDPNRVPFPDEHEPGERVRLLPGEPPSGLNAMSAGSGMNCATVGPNPHCSGGLDVFRVVSVLGKAFKALTGRE